jgi:hypothetical protein
MVMAVGSDWNVSTLKIACRRRGLSTPDNQRPVAFLVQINQSNHKPRNRNEELGKRVEFREQIDAIGKDRRGVMKKDEQHRTASIKIDQYLASVRICDVQTDAPDRRSSLSARLTLTSRAAARHGGAESRHRLDQPGETLQVP